MKNECIYAVIEVTKNGDIRIKKTTSHSRMMKAVRAAIKHQHPYKVIRKAVACTTV